MTRSDAIIAKALYDASAIMYVLGCLMKKPDLLAEVEKTKLTKDDFDDKLTKSIFLAIYNLYINGANKINLVDVEAYLSQNDVAFAYYKKSGGQNFLSDAEDLAEVDNFNYYYNRVKKFTALRQLEKKGFSTKKVYNPDIDLPTKQREMLERFDAMTLKDIFDTIMQEYSEVEAEFVGSLAGGRGTIYDGMEELFASLSKVPELGFPLQGEIMNTALRGARRSKYYLRSAPSGAGKALPNSTKIPTPSGWKFVGDVQVGDYLFDRHGSPTKVLGVYPQGKKKVWEVDLVDGRTALCCEDHLWSFYTQDSEQLITESLKDMTKRWPTRMFLPRCGAAEYDGQKIDFDPYQFGLNLNHEDIPQTLIQGTIEQRRAFFLGLLSNPKKLNAKQEDDARLMAFGLGQYYSASVNKMELVHTTEIFSIRELNYSEEMTCFLVDNDEHLFLMNDYIVTHNSRLAVGDACGLSFPIRYDKRAKKWVGAGFNEKVLFITTEMSVDELQTMIWAYLADVNEEKILFNSYEEDEEDRVKEAMAVAEKYKGNFFWEHIPDPSIENITAAIRHQVRTNGVTHVFYDYIFSSPSLLREFSGQSIREDVILSLLSTRLKDLANELGIFVASSTQLNRSWENEAKTGIRNQNMIRGSTGIVDKIDAGYITVPVMEEELKALENIIQQYGLKKPTHVTDIYKLRRGRWKDIRVWSNVDLGTCRSEDLFATNALFNLVDIPILKFSYGEEW